MNTVIISGRITKDIELKTTNSGISVVRFTVAVRSSRKDADGKAVSDFISCIAWRSTAEFIEKYFSKGKWIEVRGELQTGSYEKNGTKVYTTDVVVDKVDFGNGEKDKTETFSNANPDEFTSVDIEGEDLPF